MHRRMWGGANPHAAERGEAPPRASPEGGTCHPLLHQKKGGVTPRWIRTHAWLRRRPRQIRRPPHATKEEGVAEEEGAVAAALHVRSVPTRG